MSTNDSPDTENKNGISVFGYIRRWFLAGFLVTAPILLTGYLTWLIIGIIDGYVSNFLPRNLNPQTYVDFPLPGFGLIIGGAMIGSAACSSRSAVLRCVCESARAERRHGRTCGRRCGLKNA